MRIRVVRNAEDSDTNVVTFGDSDTGCQLAEQWLDGIVIFAPEKSAPDQVVVFVNGESHFYDEGKPFTPRVEDWADVKVVVLADIDM